MEKWLKMNRSYLDLIKLDTFEERYKYLQTNNTIGIQTFGGSRILNQKFYRSSEWRKACRSVILRDNGCDLGIPGLEISGPIYVHHINPISKDDILNKDPCLIDLNNLISTSFKTHQAIHYGTIENTCTQITFREPNDTCPWKKED